MDDSGAVTWGDGVNGTRGLVTMQNSVLSGVASGGDSMTASFLAEREILLVGRELENLVTLMRKTFALATATDGNGTGSIAVNPPGDRFGKGAVVTLTANADAGSGFIGWSGDCAGEMSNVCTLTISGATSATATFTLLNKLSINTDGTGVGSVATNPAGTAFLPDTLVTLTATPNAGSTFTGWSGDCAAETTNTCALIMNASKNVTANFVLLHMLAVSTTGDGTGSVSINPEQAAYLPGTLVTLTATPNTGSTFAGWGGDCAAETTNICALTMNGNKSVSATFAPIVDPNVQFTLTLANAGNGGGTIGVDPAAASYPQGTVVTLTATPDSNSAFSAWGGDCAAEASPVCRLTMSGNKSVSAIFSLTAGNTPINPDDIQLSNTVVVFAPPPVVAGVFTVGDSFE